MDYSEGTSSNPEFGVFPKLSTLLSKCFATAERIDAQVIRLEKSVTIARVVVPEEDMKEVGIADETVRRMEYLLKELKSIEETLRNQTQTLLGMPEPMTTSTSEL